MHDDRVVARGGSSDIGGRPHVAERVKPCIYPDSGDTGHGSRPRKQVFKKRDPPCRVWVSLRRKRNTHGQKTLRVISEVDALHRDKRTTKQTGPGPQNERQGDFGDYERLAKTRLSGASR